MAAWVAGWWRQIEAEAADPVARAAAMDAVNPLYSPRNHRVEAPLKAAEGGEMASWDRLLDVVRHPYDERAVWQDITGPAPEELEPYKTFCGTCALDELRAAVHPAWRVVIHPRPEPPRSEERRVGKEGVCHGSNQWERP